MKSKNMVLIACAVAACVCGWWCFSRCGERAVQDSLSHERERHQAKERRRVKRVKAKALLVQKGAERKEVKREYIKKVRNRNGKELLLASLGGGSRDDGIFRDEDGKPFSARGQEIMKLAGQAVDKEDLDLARDLAEKALTATEQPVRLAAVEALGWFGEDVLPELLPFMGDPDEEVAGMAKDRMLDAIQEIEDDDEKATTVRSTLSAITDADALEDVANELIGIDELAAMQTIVDVIDDNRNPKAVAAAKEVYNSITGDDFVDIEEAEAWLQENYVSDDEDGDEEK